MVSNNRYNNGESNIWQNDSVNNWWQKCNVDEWDNGQSELDWGGSEGHEVSFQGDLVYLGWRFNLSRKGQARQQVKFDWN